MPYYRAFVCVLAGDVVERTRKGTNQKINKPDIRYNT